MPIQRSRGGCHNCKRRKRKCDETRPQCRACQSRGDSCGGYNIQLKWNASRVSPSHLSNASEGSARKTNDLSGHSPAGSASTVSTQDSPSETMQVSASGRATAVEREAFERFLKSGVHTIYATTVYEWVKPLIGQYAQQSLALLVVCANLQILLEDGPSVKFHSHFERVLDIFRGELFASSGELNSATLGAGLLLCTLSLLQGQEWTNNLQCIVDFYNLRSDMRSLQTVPDRYARHCLEVMGVMDLPNMVLGRRTDCLGFWQQLRQAQKRWPDCEIDGVEPVSGIPRTLLDICTRIQDPAAEVQFWLWHGQVGEFIQCQLWEAFRFAGMLDHRRRWRQKSQLPAPLPPGVSLPASKELLFRLLSALEALWQGLKQKENAHVLVANATLYPWFVASLEVKLLCENPHWKGALDRFHSNFHASDPSRNIKIAEEIVAEAQQDHTESFDIERIARQRPVEIALF